MVLAAARGTGCLAGCSLWPAPVWPQLPGGLSSSRIRNPCSQLPELVCLSSTQVGAQALEEPVDRGESGIAITVVERPSLESVIGVAALVSATIAITFSTLASVHASTASEVNSQS